MLRALKAAQFNSFAIITVLSSQSTPNMQNHLPTLLLKKRFILLAFLLPVLAFLALGVIERYAQLAPQVTFNTLVGKRITLKELRDKPVIVTFWASDCPACLKEIPDFIDLYKQYHHQGLEIIAVAMFYDPPNRVINLTRQQQLPYPVALDLEGEIAHAFGDVHIIPTSFLIAPDGSIALQKTGLLDINEIKTYLTTYFKG